MYKIPLCKSIPSGYCRRTSSAEPSTSPNVNRSWPTIDVTTPALVRSADRIALVSLSVKYDTLSSATIEPGCAYSASASGSSPIRSRPLPAYGLTSSDSRSRAQILWNPAIAMNRRLPLSSTSQGECKATLRPGPPFWNVSDCSPAPASVVTFCVVKSTRRMA